VLKFKPEPIGDRWLCGDEDGVAVLHVGVLGQHYSQVLHGPQFVHRKLEGDLVFAPAHPPTKSRAAAKVMFFPHLKTQRKGILNAIANESIPVEVRFPKPVSSVTLVLWGSVGSAALVEAYDTDDKVVDRASKDRVPERSGPEQAIPSIELTVKASAISYVRFAGAPPGGYLVCDEVRFTPPKPR
jgi:hypothetical protein